MSTKSITKLTSYEQACQLTGENPSVNVTDEARADIMYRAACKLLGFKTKMPDWQINKYTRPLLAHRNLQIIRDAVTGNWEPNWDDSNQYKWFPWFYMNKPGFRFLVSHFDYAHTGTAGGPRLCFQDRAQSDFVGKNCISLYRDLLGAV